MEQIYLSRRNLMVLLSKLNRRAAGQETACTIIKNDTKHLKFPQTISSCAITAIEDSEYYVNRVAGEMHPLDIPKTE